jgi:predicted nucleic acid-binding Zn ribbon protein
MTGRYTCTCCSTCQDVVVVVPIEDDGYLKCPHCGSIELEEVESDGNKQY